MTTRILIAVALSAAAVFAGHIDNGASRSYVNAAVAGMVTNGQSGVSFSGTTTLTNFVVLGAQTNSGNLTVLGGGNVVTQGQLVGVFLGLTNALVAATQTIAGASVVGTVASAAEAANATNLGGIAASSYITNGAVSPQFGGIAQVTNLSVLGNIYFPARHPTTRFIYLDDAPLFIERTNSLAGAAWFGLYNSGNQVMWAIDSTTHINNLDVDSFLRCNSEASFINAVSFSNAVSVHGGGNVVTNSGITLAAGANITLNGGTASVSLTNGATITVASTATGGGGDVTLSGTNTMTGPVPFRLTNSSARVEWSTPNGSWTNYITMTQTQMVFNIQGTNYVFP